jgi:hypothetical protein
MVKKLQLPHFDSIDFENPKVRVKPPKRGGSDDDEMLGCWVAGAGANAAAAAAVLLLLLPLRVSVRNYLLRSV